jgi:hypothetical protein
METESGGSKGSSGTHDGGTKGIFGESEGAMHQLMRNHTRHARSLTDCTMTIDTKQHNTEVKGIRGFQLLKNARRDHADIQR